MQLEVRAHDELRPIKITSGYVAYPEGSALIEMGNTRVLCNASVLAEVPPWLAGRGRGWVTAEYALLPRSTHTRTPRETQGLRGRTQEIRRLIGRSLRAAVDLEALGERQVIVDCDVIQADGGTRTASVTGGYIALALALKGLVEAGLVPPHVFRTAIAAVSVGIVDGEQVLDLSYAQDRRADVDLNVVMTDRGRYVEVQGTAEGATFDRASLDSLLDLAAVGIAHLLRIQKEIVSGEKYIER
jgi:ribonuclease PH